MTCRGKAHYAKLRTEREAEEEKRLRELQKIRDTDLQVAVHAYKELPWILQEKILKYMRKEAGVLFIDHLGITEESPLVEQFERIYKIIPNEERKKVLWQILK